MVSAEKYELKQLKDLSEKQVVRIDDFIMKGTTNGEFINTSYYLGYHPAGRFQDDSVVVLDQGSGEVRGVMMAAYDGNGTVVSHPGTTFAGPVVDRNAKIEVIEIIMEKMLGYYESRYSEVIIKKTPDYYTKQPFHLIDYILLQRGYTFGMSALANIINIDGIDSEDAILSLFHPKRRNQVKKVISEHNFIFSAEEEIREAVWSNMNENLHNKFDSKTTHTLAEIRELKGRYPEQIRTYYVDTPEGDYSAFSLAFLFKNVFHTQYLDVNYEYARQYPNLLLIKELIKIARELGYRYFSFGASTEDGGKILNYGLYDYKAEYGGGDILLPVYARRTV